MESLVILAIVCFVLAAVLIAVEVFVPSAGMLTLAAVLMLITGVVLLWQVSTLAAMTAVVVIVMLASVAGWVFFRHFQDLPFTRRLMLVSQQEPVAPADTRAAMVGRAGVALTDLRPVGHCLIDGERLECVSEAGVIKRDQPVRIVRASGLEIKVRVDE